MSKFTELDPRAVTNLILECANSTGIEVTNLSAQKLLYFCHASYLAAYKVPLISGIFEAWEYGPVCPLVYDELKHFGKSKITSKIFRRDLFTKEEISIPVPNNTRVVSHVFKVVEQLGKLSAGKLVDLSHKKGGAWDSVWNNSGTSVTFNNRIDDNLILEKFQTLMISVKSEQVMRGEYESAPFTGNRPS